MYHIAIYCKFLLIYIVNKVKPLFLLVKFNIVENFKSTKILADHYFIGK